MQGRTPRSAPPGGFTLFELLVALLVASVLMTMVYAVYIQASRTFRVQNMALEMQTQLRYGLDDLKRDLANAGFQATVNSTLDSRVCQLPTSELRAITVKEADPTALFVDTTANTMLKPVEITLFGDYSSQGQSFFTDSVTSSLITLQAGFVTELQSETEWNRLFGPNRGRFVVLLTLTDTVIIQPILSSDYSTGTITVSGTIPLNDPICGGLGTGQGLLVNSAHHVRYAIRKHPTELERTDLVREEVAHDGVTTIANSRLLVAENIIDISLYDAVFDISGESSKSTPNMDIVPDNSALALADGLGTGGRLGSLGTAHDLRFVTVALTARTSDEDLDLIHRRRASLTSPIHTFDVSSNLEGAARAMTLTSRVMFNTITVNNLNVPGS